MDVNGLTPGQVDGLRRAFRIVNRFMVFMWKIGLGRAINVWPAVGGRIMIIRHRGRKTGRERLAPVNYAVVDGEVYCTSGFGAISDWYRNLMAGPDVELWLPEGRVRARAEDISDSPRRCELLREVLIASGFAAPLFGIHPRKLDEADLAGMLQAYRLVHFAR